MTTGTAWAQAATGERLQRGRLGGIALARDRRPAGRGKRVAFRADAAFARPAIYEALEARGVGYAIRIPANKHLGPGFPIWLWYFYPFEQSPCLDLCGFRVWTPPEQVTPCG